MISLLSFHQQQGAMLNDAETAVLSFGNDDQVLAAFKHGEGCVVGDRSHWGLIEFTGADRQRFLHNQSTNQILQLQPGQSCETVLINSTARTLDLGTVHIFPDKLWLQVSPNKTDFLMAWFDRFLFPMDKVNITNLTGQFNVMTLYGTKAKVTLEHLTATPLEALSKKGNQAIAINNITINNTEVICAAGTDLGLDGYTLFIPRENAVEIWQKMMALGAIPMGETVWEKQRIHQGRPAPDTELTEDYNPLEAGLWHCVSFDKGCYIGQETIARLNTYKGVKQRLLGLQLSEVVEVGTKLTVDGDRAGIVTSVDAEQKFALGYVRVKSAGVGDRVTVGENVTAEIVAVPYVSHNYPDL